MGRSRSSGGGGGGGNSWNSFQHAHAGQGYSSSQMSSMYRSSGASQSYSSGYAPAATYSDACGGSAYHGSSSSEYAAPAVPAYQAPSRSGAAATSGGNAWNQFQHSHAGQNWSQEHMQQEYRSLHNPTADQAAMAGHGSLGNAWNAFQHDNAGQGWSRLQMQQAYRAEPPAAAKPVQASGNAWNEFQHAHAYKNWSAEYMAEKYRRTQLWMSKSESSNDGPAVGASSSGNAWNTFQHDNAGKGWSKQQMQQAYRATPAAAKPVQAPVNAWNDFQHDYSSKGWSQEHMQQEYRRAKWQDFQSKNSGKAWTSDQMQYNFRHKAEVSVSPAAAAAAKQPLSWNEFQHAHGGIGWSRDQLSAAYAKAKAASATAEAGMPAGAETLNWNAFQHANAGKHWSIQKMSEEYQSARQQAVDLRQQSADVQKHSEWQAYLHRHKGQGWTQKDLRLVYAELHAVAHASRETVARVEARWQKNIGHALALRGQPLHMMTSQLLKHMQHEPVKLLADEHGYKTAAMSSQVEGIYFLCVAKASIKHPKESDLHVKYVGKADGSIKDRLNAHGHGGRDNLWDEMGRAIKAGYKVYARELPAPLGGALIEDAILRSHNFQWNHVKNGGRFNGSLDAADRAMLNVSAVRASTRSRQAYPREAARRAAQKIVLRHKAGDAIHQLAEELQWYQAPYAAHNSAPGLLVPSMMATIDEESEGQGCSGVLFDDVQYSDGDSDEEDDVYEDESYGMSAGRHYKQGGTKLDLQVQQAASELRRARAAFCLAVQKVEGLERMSFGSDEAYRKLLPTGLDVAEEQAAVQLAAAAVSQQNATELDWEQYLQASSLHETC